jgi:hypothetical protein
MSTTKQTTHYGLPVAGYKPQSADSIDAANVNKMAEERILRRLDAMGKEASTSDALRWLAIARTHIELGFMAMNRAIFQPGRVTLPEDSSEAES